MGSQTESKIYVQLLSIENYHNDKEGMETCEKLISTFWDQKGITPSVASEVVCI